MFKADDHGELRVLAVRALGGTEHWGKPGTGGKGQVADMWHILSLCDCSDTPLHSTAI